MTVDTAHFPSHCMEFRAAQEAVARHATSKRYYEAGACWSVARLDSRDSFGGGGSAKALEVHSAGGQQIVNAPLEVT
jgi:hypothetical protein